MQADFEIVEVFGTGAALTGGPLGVVIGDLGADDAVLQRLAARLAMPETVILDRHGDDGTVAVRIFTPYVELGFAGHPLLGAAAVAVRHTLVSPGDVALRTREGTVHAYVSPDAGTAHLAERTCHVGAPLGVGVEAICAAVGLPEGAAAGPVRVASAGLAFACLPVDSVHLEEARALPADVAALPGRLPDLSEVFGVAVFVPRLPRVRARVFVPEPLCAEDPATGSAALAIAGWLAQAHGFGAEPARFDVVQGSAELGLSHLRVRARKTDESHVLASVGGSVRRLVHGRLTL
ncbi:PhzF family phenazine biosynthesis protein [Nonomuraea roseola]|uniref:PhzF family phenazine biosynthesis protein n=1 Tax=Nonomuraea roseola TaxID=46179 RepID=A0ABV5Q8A3_9ACTN